MSYSTFLTLKVIYILPRIFRLLLFFFFSIRNTYFMFFYAFHADKHPSPTRNNEQYDYTFRGLVISVQVRIVSATGTCYVMVYHWTTVDKILLRRMYARCSRYAPGPGG